MFYSRVSLKTAPFCLDGERPKFWDHVWNVTVKQDKRFCLISDVIEFQYFDGGHEGIAQIVGLHDQGPC